MGSIFHQTFDKMFDKFDRNIYLQNADLSSFLWPVFPSFLYLLRLQGLAFCSAFDEVEFWMYFLWCQQESSISKGRLLKMLQEQIELYSNRINNIGNFPTHKNFLKNEHLELF